MMKSSRSSTKIGQILLFTFLLTLICILVAKIDYSEYISTKFTTYTRSVLEEKDIERICKKASDELITYYNLDIFKYTSESKGNPQPIIDYLIDNDTGHFKDYISRVAPYAVFIILSIIFLIIWIPLCICCCCPCCCCYQKKDEKCCRSCSCLTALILYGGVVAGSVVALIISKNFVKGINGTSCAIFKVYHTVIDGEALEKPTPKWAGIQGIKNALNATVDAISSIGENSNNLKTSQEQTKSKIDEVSNKFPTYSDNTTTKDSHKKPSPYRSENSILPTFYENYSPIDTPGKTLYNIQYEYNTVFNTSFQAIKAVSDNSEAITNSASSINATIGESMTTITDIEGTFNDFSSDILNDWLKYQDYINDYANTVFYALTGVLMFFGIVGFICVFFYTVTDKCNCLRIILHIVWNFLALFTFIIMLLGSIFGLLGIVGTDGVGVISYIFGEDNLIKSGEPIVLTGDTGVYINTCVNGNGDLAEQLGLKNQGEGLQQIEELYKLEKTINNITKTFAEYNGNLKTLANLEDEISKQEKDISNSHVDVDKAINEINNMQEVRNKNDEWVTIKEKCTKNYCPITNGNGGCCLVITELNSTTLTTVQSRYGQPSNPQDIFSRFKDYIEENKKIINEVKELKTQMKTDVKNVFNNMSESIETSDIIVKSISSIYSNIVGEGEVYAIVNCTFIGTNLKILFDQLDNKLGKNATGFAVSILFVSCCAGLSNIFVLIVINRFKKKSSPKQEDIKETSFNGKEAMNYSETKKTSQELHPGDINININTEEA